MSNTIKLNAISRDQLDQPQAKNYVLAELYGPGIINQHLAIKTLELDRAYQQAGMSQLLDLSIDSQMAVKVVIKDKQRRLLTNRLQHVDFYQVKMDQAITINVPLVGQNLSKLEAVGAQLNHGLTELIIECLPAYLVNQIEVDLSGLQNIGDSLRVSDLQLPAKLHCKNQPDEVVFSVIELR